MAQVRKALVHPSWDQISCNKHEAKRTLRDESYDIWDENLIDRIKDRLDIAEE